MQVLALCVGDPNEKTLQKLWFEVPPVYRLKLVYTDFYEAYAKWFAPWQHRPCEKGSGKTSVIEGLHNKWRNLVSGLVRRWSENCLRALLARLGKTALDHDSSA